MGALAKSYAAGPAVISLALRNLAGQGRLTAIPLDPRRNLYLAPSDGRPPPPAPRPPPRALTAVILLWDDGTRTHLTTTQPAPANTADEPAPSAKESHP